MEYDAVRNLIEHHLSPNRPFNYRRGAYACRLLKAHVGGGKPIRELRRGRFSNLLKNPAVQRSLQRAGDGVLTPDRLYVDGQDDLYSLCGHHWGSDSPKYFTFFQTSRKGFNLVLQLNFSHEHNRHYGRLIREKDTPFRYRGHPVSKVAFTLAWARIDIDLTDGSALIEEIQSDWVRSAMEGRDLAEACLHGTKRAKIRARKEFDDWFCCRPRDVICYVDRVLKPYAACWDEAMMAAAVLFLTELGVREIYYHTHESGSALKHITERKPPRSLYTSLPRRFCFEKTNDAPKLLQHSNEKRIRRILGKPSTRFYRLVI